MKQRSVAFTAGTCRIRIRKQSVQICHDGHEYCLRASRGWRYLGALLEYPGLPFRPWQLELPELEQKRPDDYQYTNETLQQADLHYSDLLPGNPLADFKALKQIKQRLNFLLEAIATAREYSDYGAIEDLLEEKEALEQYLQQVYTPNGRIREFASEGKQQQCRVLRSIMRTLEQLKPIDPPLAEYLARHLKLGSWIVFVPGKLEIVLQQD